MLRMIDSLLMLIAVFLLLLSAAMLPFELQFDEPEPESNDAAADAESFSGEALPAAA